MTYDEIHALRTQRQELTNEYNRNIAKIDAQLLKGGGGDWALYGVLWRKMLPGLNAMMYVYDCNPNPRGGVRPGWFVSGETISDVRGPEFGQEGRDRADEWLRFTMQRWAQARALLFGFDVAHDKVATDGDREVTLER